jgi:hypothetical protein
MQFPDQTVHDDSARGKVRTTDPDTSWLAALLINPDELADLHKTVLNIIRLRGPVTHDGVHEVYYRAGGTRSDARIRHIVRDLVDDGLVEEADRKGKTRSGNPSTRWQLVAEERQVAA